MSSASERSSSSRKSNSSRKSTSSITSSRISAAMKNMSPEDQRNFKNMIGIGSNLSVIPEGSETGSSSSRNTTATKKSSKSSKSDRSNISSNTQNTSFTKKSNNVNKFHYSEEFMPNSPILSPREPEILNTDEFYTQDSYVSELKDIRDRYPDEPRRHRLYAKVRELSKNPESRSVIMNDSQYKGLSELMQNMEVSNPKHNISMTYQTPESCLSGSGYNKLDYYKSRNGSVRISANR